MNWSNIRLILAREIRDQLRDRRTMFMIVVLPVLVYPLLAMTFSQLSQFAQERPTRVLVLGTGEVPGLPPLFTEGRFSAELFVEPKQPELQRLDFADLPADPVQQDALSEAWRAVRDGPYDAALYFPPDFSRQMQAFRQALARRAPGTKAELPHVPAPEIVCTSAKEKSQLARQRLLEVLIRWRNALAGANLAAAGVPQAATAPYGDLVIRDVAGETLLQGAAMWSKILPLMLVLWAMTGAFYPAVDLCAGEKERGTLETLLSSPARRSEIVLGKLLTIMLFSGLTAILNLACATVLGCRVMGQMPGFAVPSLAMAMWLAIALLPVTAVFSALSLALAAFARSTKEGQYYLMPLLLVTMPLAVLPMSSGIELNLGMSLIPITGIVLLLRTALEGNYLDAVQYLLPVIAVTSGCCFLAICWAVDLFNSETVLFREGDRLDPRLWLRHTIRDRLPTPSASAAVCCALLILLLRSVLSLTLPKQAPSFAAFAQLQVSIQLAVILLPTVLMAIVLTSSPRRTLLLHWPRWGTIVAAAALAAAMHPLVSELGKFILRLYPINAQMQQVLREMHQQVSAGAWWQVLLVIAVLPAVCEELAFRGFILSGFHHEGRTWRAIAYSAVFFGFSHAVIQQQLVTVVMGFVLGFLAVRSGSILPGIVFHVVNNSLSGLIDYLAREVPQRWPAMNGLLRQTADGEPEYGWPLILSGAVASTLIVWWFARVPAREADKPTP